MAGYLGIDCGSVSLNVVLLNDNDSPVHFYLRTDGKPLQSFVQAVRTLASKFGPDRTVSGAMVTGSARLFFSKVLGIPAINEIIAHATGTHHINPQVRTIIEIGGQDSKFIRLAPGNSVKPSIELFRMNEICAAGTGAFLDEQARRLGISLDVFGETALKSTNPAPIAGRCAVFAKTDMIHHCQEGRPLPDILMGLAFSLARNYISTLIKGEPPATPVSMQGGVMSNPAVVKAFRDLLRLESDSAVVPPYFKVMGALGCAILAEDHGEPISLGQLKDRAAAGLTVNSTRSTLKCLPKSASLGNPDRHDSASIRKPPFIMGLDVGSVSVKGVVIDSTNTIVHQEYRLSESRPLEALESIMGPLLTSVPKPDFVAVTGSGRNLVSKLLKADLTVNEITAQSAAALHYMPEVECVVEIGGQDSKCIFFEQGMVKDFQMNRVCAAGTGSFLMAQAQRLGLNLNEFADAAFSAEHPVDLGTRCTVFMESDLVHHQNNGAAVNDLAAGVCISIAKNFLEGTANFKPLGDRVLFMGGVAANNSVRAAFELLSGKRFVVPDSFRVSGAFGAALKASERFLGKEVQTASAHNLDYKISEIASEHFSCSGCENSCRIYRYRLKEETVFNGGICDRWESGSGTKKTTAGDGEKDLFSLRTSFFTGLPESVSSRTWGMVRSPQYYEFFPFWHGFTRELGISLQISPPSSRRDLENGGRFRTVEACLPMKVTAGQMEALVESGVEAVFHPVVLSEPGLAGEAGFRNYCPYIQGSSLFFKGAVELDWQEVIVIGELDDHAFHSAHARFARKLGFSHTEARNAVDAGTALLNDFKKMLTEEGRRFPDTLQSGEKAVVILGKPYHTSDPFLNMHLPVLLKQLGVKAVPADILPLSGKNSPVTWKFQGHSVKAAEMISADPRLFPILISFFGCGPDPFTIRHIKRALKGKPLLVLEMDEHSSRAGLITRIEAYLDSIKGKNSRSTPRGEDLRTRSDLGIGKSCEKKSCGRKGPKVLYLPNLGDNSFAFAAAALSLGIDTRVLPPADRESEDLGRSNVVGGECSPYALILGDYLKLAQSGAGDPAGLFFMISPDACKLAQFPVYIEMVRRKLGLSIPVVQSFQSGLEILGLNARSRRHLLLRAWEGLIAYDILFKLYVQLRPFAKNKALLESIYSACVDKLCSALANNRVREGLDEVIHDLHLVSIDSQTKPVIAVTGDYYTRVVAYANNNVYLRVEELGGRIWTPPTFSDCFKFGTLRDFAWSAMNFQSRAAAGHFVFYCALLFKEFRIRGIDSARNMLNSSTDILGIGHWERASRYADTRLPAGITAPIATTLEQVEMGADGVLNLMTLNCSFGTVVTAALFWALKKKAVPMLTLVYEGQKQTNERTRLEAFMDQVHDRFCSKNRRAG